MNRIRNLTFLMVLSMVVIAGFQVYWLGENYNREKKSLEIRTGISFRESVNKLQAKKLKLDLPGKTEKPFQYHVTVKDGLPPDSQNSVEPRKELIGMVNIIRDKVSDSDTNENSAVVISMDQSALMYRQDSDRNVQKEVRWNGKVRLEDKWIQLLYGIDSLQDSLRVKEIQAGTRQAFLKEKIDVPFQVIRQDSFRTEYDLPFMGEVKVGISKPVVYRLVLGNTFPYLAGRIISPFLFSVFLMGVTLLSFLLLYRNMLQQKRLSDLKNEFISNVTHELKTPIATVHVAIEALRNFNAIDDPQRTKEYLDISQNELQRLSLLVDKVLKLSMFENKQVQLSEEVFGLDEVVEEVLKSMRLQIEKRNARVSWERGGQHFEIKGDRLHITSVVYNLLDNALKYSNGSPEIDLRLKEETNSLLFTIADKGIGIPRAFRQKVFEKFFRVPHGNTHNVKGYGLGLSYVAHIVQLHGGTIGLDSDEGAGARFVISIPKANV